MKFSNTLDHYRDLCACGKVPFTKKDAITKQHWLEKRGKDRLRIYECRMSDSWHLTKSDKYKK